MTTQKAYPNETLTKQYDYLIRKIDDTRRSRFQMAARLREEHEWRNKLMLFYNIIIITLSIITLYQYFTENIPLASYLILAFSISLSLYSTHLGGMSRLEIASVMNQNANSLSMILSLVQESRNRVYTYEEHLQQLRDYTEKYESTINNVQNHADIDYFHMKLNSRHSRSSSFVYTSDMPLYEKIEVPQAAPKKKEPLDREQILKDFQAKIDAYKAIERRKRYGGYAFGIFLALIILCPAIINYFSN